MEYASKRLNLGITTKCIILVCISICITADSPPAPSVMDKIGENLDFVARIANMSTLEYGDSCHFEETKLKEIVEKGLEAIMKSDAKSMDLLESQLDKFNKEIKTILTTVQSVCDGRKLLMCDESTSLCDCGPLRFSNRDFSFIKGSNGDCMWAEDTPCFPTDDLSGNHCANNTKCAFTNKNGENKVCDFTMDNDDRLQKCNCKSNVEVEIEKEATKQ